jgi:uncharacterized phiE125 gp8 family phage protein
MGLRQITAPAEWPVTLEEAKAHLRVDVDDDNEMIEALIEAAVDYCDGPTGFLGRALIDQTWELVLDEFPEDEIKIPIPPLIEVESIKYDDGDGAQQTISSSDYTVDNVSQPGWVLPVSGTWPTTFEGVNAVRVRFRCGYLDQVASPPVHNVPGSIKAAIKLIVGNLYANRETIVLGQTVAEIPQSAQFLLRKHRIHLGMA